MKPKYNWVAVYSDSSRLPQYNENGSESRYADIDRIKLVAFEFYKEGKLLLVCDIAPGSRLIYRRRVEQVSGNEPQSIYLIGWQKKTIEGKNSQSIACVPAYNDTIVFVDGWREGSRWLYPVEEFQFEKE